jgi:cell division septation protein DedD
MHHRQGRWLVHDVLLDGVSLVENYRAQFQKVMQRSSYAELVTEMRARTADLGRPVPPVAVAAAPAPLLAATVAAAASPADAAPSARMELVAAEHRSAVPAWDVPRPVAGPAAAFPPVAVLGLAMRRERAAPAVKSDLVRASEPPLVAAVSEPRRPPARASQFWVQVGAFRSEEKAIQVATALSDQTVSLFTEPNEPLLRVLVGPFANRDAALSKLREIRARGYEAFIPAATN